MAFTANSTPRYSNASSLTPSSAVATSGHSDCSVVASRSDPTSARVEPKRSHELVCMLQIARVLGLKKDAR
jgi:hypothetical protein